MYKPGRWLSVKLIGLLLVILAVLITVIGFLNVHYNLPLIKPVEYFIADFYANISAELIGIAFTVLIIDQLYERSRIRQAKEQLIRQMGGADHGLALVAVDELRAQGWIYDGSLRKVSFYQANLNEARLFSADLEQTDFTGANLENVDLKWANLCNAKLNSANLANSMLIGANLAKARLQRANLGGAILIDADLQEADLTEANLTHACLWGANFRGACVTEVQLRKAIMLHEAIMPDGDIYDGRFNLAGDVTLGNETKVVDDITTMEGEVPAIVCNSEIHARQFLRWKWVVENVMEANHPEVLE